MGGGNACKERAMAATNVRQVVMAAMDTGQAVALTMNVGRAGVVKRVIATIM